MEVKLRNEISDEFKWNLKDLYANSDEFEKDFNIVSESISKLKDFEKLDISLPNIFKELYDLLMDNSKRFRRLNDYASRYYDQEQNNENADILNERLSNLSTELGLATSFLDNTIVNFSNEQIDRLLSDNTIKDYHICIKEKLRSKSHILSKVENELLCQLSDSIYTPNDVYTTFKNTEMKYDNITKPNGEIVYVDDQTFRELRQDDNREVRKLAFDSFFGTFNNYKNTYSKLIFKYIKGISSINKIEHYDSSLESALFDDNIPVNIYNGLVENIHKNLDSYHEYLSLRKNIMGINDMNYYDLYNSIVKEINDKYSYDEAKDLVIKSTSILGEDYTKIMNDALTKNWIDVYPNKFKDTGAYMSGSSYDVHPYILMNYMDDFNSVSTLAHELGHLAHSVYSNTNQPYVKSSYATFIAEIASTTNEILLIDYIMKHTDNKDLKIFLLNQYIENFRTTVFRQTMFGEFEKFMYDTVEKGETLTSSVLNGEYYNLLKTYHGVDKNVMNIDETYSNEWMYVPHFYYNFYVYQYATSYISSVIIASKIINGDVEQLNKFKELLKSGCSDYPVDLLKKAGVDLTDENSYKIAFDSFKENIQQLKDLL